jgi:hypothetical protein
MKPVRPQDLKFTQKQLDKAFGKKMTHAAYLKSLKAGFGKKYENEE